MSLISNKKFSGFIFILVLTVTLNSSTTEVFGYQEDEGKALLQKYTWGFILLTPDDLMDIHYMIINKPSLKELIQSENPNGLNLLASFLQRTVLNGSIKFTNLVIELTKMRAGFIIGHSNVGTINPLNWIADEVYNIAVWCDNYLRNIISLYNVESKMRSGEFEIREIWGKVKEIENNEYISSMKTARLKSNLRSYIDLNQETFGELKEQDQETYMELKKFRENYDTSLFTNRYLFRNRLNPDFDHDVVVWAAPGPASNKLYLYQGPGNRFELPTREFSDPIFIDPKIP